MASDPFPGPQNGKQSPAYACSGPRRAVERTSLCKRQLIVVIAVLCVLFACVASVERWHTNKESYRFGIFGSYAAALEHYSLEGTPVAETLQQLIDDYNAYDRKLTSLPPDPAWPLPSYRPAKHLTGGPYLVLIEGPPPRWYFFRRYVVYANPDGHVMYFRLVRSHELEELIRKDDLLRADKGSE